MASENKSSFALIFVLWLAGLCAAAQFAKISVIFPQLREIYAGAGVATGFLVSLLSLCGAVLGLFAGIVVARFGYRSLLLAALAAGAAVSLFQAFLPPLPLMLASRVIEGASHLVIVVAAPTLIAQVTADRHRAAALTLWGTFFGVAFALVAWIGIPLANAYGVPSLFVAHALAMLLSAVLLFVMLPKLETGGRSSEPLGLANILHRHAATYRSPFMSAPALGWLFYTLGFVSVITLLPDYVDQRTRAIAVSFMPLASVAVSMTLGVALLRRLTAVQVIAVGFAAAAVFAALIWLSAAAVWACIGLFAALGLVQGASFAAVPQLNGPHHERAYANGALAQMGNIGNMSGTPLLLLTMDRFGFNGLVVFILICCGGGALVHLLLHLKRRSRLS